MLTLFSGLIGVSSRAPLDWGLATAASVVFVAVVAIPALALNARDRKRHQAERDRSA